MAYYKAFDYELSDKLKAYIDDAIGKGDWGLIVYQQIDFIPPYVSARCTLQYKGNPLTQVKQISEIKILPVKANQCVDLQKEGNRAIISAIKSATIKLKKEIIKAGV